MAGYAPAALQVIGGQRKANPPSKKERGAIMHSITNIFTKDETRMGEKVNELQIFENETLGLKVRTILNDDGSISVNAEDTAIGFGWTQEKNGVTYVKWERINGYCKEFGFSPLVGKDDYIPEPLFYRLGMKANNAAADKFQNWLAMDVIPSIRKHGMYATDKVIDNILNNPDFGIELLTKLKEERAARVEAEKKNAILMHVNKTYTMTEIAKELGMKSAIQLNKLLAEKKIQYQVNGTWVFYSQYSDLGYEEIKQEILDSGKVIYHRRITQMGREFILNLFNVEAA